MQHIAITGANRGIGLEFVRQYVARPETVIYAMTRLPDEKGPLQELAAAAKGRIHIIMLECADDNSIHDAADAIAAKTDRIDILINNAAINPPGAVQYFDTITSDVMLHVLHINTVAPMLIVQAMVGLLRKGSLPKIVNISSEMGSLNGRDYGGFYGYCTSKAALNMVTRGMAIDLNESSIVTIALDPGWVQTDMGGEEADLTPQESVSGMLRVIDSLTRKDNGAFLRWTGHTLPW